MLTITECRKLLGKQYELCTDEQIEKIRAFLYKLAEIDGVIKKTTEYAKSSFIRARKHR